MNIIKFQNIKQVIEELLIFQELSFIYHSNCIDGNSLEIGFVKWENDVGTISYQEFRQGDYLSYKKKENKLILPLKIYKANEIKEYEKVIEEIKSSNKLE